MRETAAVAKATIKLITINVLLPAQFLGSSILQFSIIHSSIKKLNQTSHFKKSVRVFFNLIRKLFCLFSYS